MQTNKQQSIVNDLGRANIFMSPPDVIELGSPIVFCTRYCYFLAIKLSYDVIFFVVASYHDS